MKKPDQPTQLAMSIKVPLTQFRSAVAWVAFSWWPPRLDRMKSTMGPLYNVINMAPPTVNRVPKTLAWLGSFLILIFSSLKSPTWRDSSVINNTKKTTKYTDGIHMRTYLYIYVDICTKFWSATVDLRLSGSTRTKHFLHEWCGPHGHWCVNGRNLRNKRLGTYLNKIAIMKVIAGRMLYSAEANVADV